MAKNTILDVKNLTKNFGKLKAVDNLSFQIREGEIVGLLGANGAGKTTTINMLLGVLNPSYGNIEYFGKEFEKNREETLKQINFCSGYIRFPWRLTVSENLDVVARLYEVKDRHSRVDKLLEIFEMSEYKSKPISSLSAGQIMRVMLTKAFINYPKLILLDEPTSSLDPDVAQKVRQFLLKEQKEFGVSMLLTSHNMAEVEELADRVIFLDHGKILTQDTPEGLATKIDLARVDLLLGSKITNAIKLCRKHNWKCHQDGKYLKVQVKEKEITKLIYALNNNGINFREISIEKPSLEDFFIGVAKGEI